MTKRETALVLGGGGVTGVAWEVGLLTGLHEAGVDLSTADLVVGTSAGAAVAAQVTSGTSFPELYARQVASTSGELPARLGPLTMLRYGWSMLRAHTPEELGRRMGRLALATKTVSEGSRRTAIASRLPKDTWPERPLQLTTVNATTGAFRVLERSSGVSLTDAVAASCAVPGVWPPVTLDDGRYVDGGMHSAVNADLAQGFARVVILAPLTVGLGVMPSVATQVRALETQGARVVVVSPDAGARKAMGRNVLDPAMRRPSAETGRRQAPTVVAAVRALWATPGLT